MKLRASTLCTGIIATFAFTTSHHLLAANSPFAGKWVFDAERSQFQAMLEKVEDLGNNEYTIQRGDRKEKFVIDGREHRLDDGTARTITPDGPNRWKQINVLDGKIIFASTWELSDGDNIKTFHMERHNPDGSVEKSEAQLQRVAGTAGIAGTWRDIKGNPFIIQPQLFIEAPDTNSLTFSYPAEQEHFTVKLDGKEVACEGAGAAPGLTVSAKRIDDQTLELTNRFKDKVRNTQTMMISSDGKTMTTIIASPGEESKELRVRDRK